MPTKPARRELGLVLAVAGAGLVAVFVVAFAPWYPAAGEVAGSGSAIVGVIVAPHGGVPAAP